ncbi:outer membrane beta-barrel protein [Tamlana crocina]
MTRTLVTIFSLFIFSIAFAQPKSITNLPDKKIIVSGKVIDKETQQPLEYATVAFFSKKKDKIVEGGITDLNGEFSIPVQNGLYDITIEYISYKKITLENKDLSNDINLGTISLEVNMEALEAVEVIAEKTTVEIKLDKKIYNIGKDLTTAGGTVSDALNNVPSVSVDIEGGISLRGNENVRILINGKPSAMAGFGDTNVLSQLPAEAIERVEVITSPSARYDAEGTAGILNIILRQKETLGFNGSVNLTVGNPDNAGLSTNLNYRTEKFNLFSNLGFRYFDSPRNSFSDTDYFNADIDEVDRVREDEDVERLNRNYNTSLGMEYFLSKKTSLTGTVFYRYGQDRDTGINISDRFIDDNLVEQTQRVEKENEDGGNFQFALNYITKFDDNGHELTADIQIETGNKEQFTYYNEDYIISQPNAEPFQIENITQDEDENESLFQIDYVLPIGKNARFEAGYRGNFENSVTDYLLEQENLDNGNLEVNDALSNVFDYSENVNAFYSQYGTKFGQFSFLLGLRLENTQLKGKIDSRLTAQELEEFYGFPIDTDFNNNYLGLFPTVNVIYNLSGDEDNAEESITFGYNRRINRPRGWYINPFPSRSSRTNIFQGNPNLSPAFASAFDLGYLKRWDKLTLTTSVYYQHETDSFERVEENTGLQTTDGIDIIRTIPVNLSTNKRTGGEFGLLYNPNKWLRLNSSFNIFQFETDGEFNGKDYSVKNTSWFGRLSSKITLPAKIDWQTNAFYMGARESTQGERDGILSIDLAFSKEIFNDNATVSLNVRDLLNSRKYQGTTTTDSYERYSERQWRQRQINLSLMYRFNQQKKRSERNRGENNGDDDDDMGF